MNVSTQGAFIIHLLRCIGVTKYAWGACHSSGEYSKMNPPDEADCSGFTLWGYDKVGFTEEGEVLHGFTGGAINILQKCRDLRQELTVAAATQRRGAHLFLMRPGVNKGNHIAVVIAPGWLIHCSSSRKGVWIERIADCKIKWTHGGYLV